MYLDSPDKSITVQLETGVATNQLEVFVDYSDYGSAIPAVVSSFLTNNSTPITIIPAPGTGVIRLIQRMAIYNNDTVAATIIFCMKIGSAYHIGRTKTLQPKEAMTYSRGIWYEPAVAGGGGGMTSHGNEYHTSVFTTLPIVKADTDIADAIAKKHAQAHTHPESEIVNLVTDLVAKEPANSNIQTHVTSQHAPSNAQKNSDILKSEIEAVLTGQISSHSHAGGGSSVGVLEDVQISVLQSDGTLNAASGVQTWCGTNKTSQDVFTVEANSTYRVRGQLYINTGATTHTTAMAWALSGATVADFQLQVMLWSAAANAIATAQSTVHVSGVASKVLNATSTAVYTIIKFEGILVVTNGGTITPQINFSANPTGTNLMKRGSWISFSKLGSDTLTKVGSWA